MANEGVVEKYGKDSSGRDILMTRYMRDWWEQVCDALGFTPTIVQGAWMSRVPGGGATDSAGYHDAGGCLDLRTWDRTPAELDHLIKTLRRHGAGAWRRDQRHGMDPHVHLVLGTDPGISIPALRQWQEYLAGGDGLTGSGADYEWRPDPLITKPPQGDDMKPEDWTRLEKLIDARIEAALEKKQGNGLTRDNNLRRAGDTKELVKELANLRSKIEGLGAGVKSGVAEGSRRGK